jgi:hypothetical protein
MSLVGAEPDIRCPVHRVITLRHQLDTDPPHQHWRCERCRMSYQRRGAAMVRCEGCAIAVSVSQVIVV